MNDLNLDRMLDEIKRQRDNARNWENTSHLLAQTLFEISQQEKFNPTKTFHDAVLAYNRTVRNKYRNPNFTRKQK